MKKFISLLNVILIFMLVSFAEAIPTLQLDIQGGTYDPLTETILSTSDPFTLYAYLIPDGKALLSDTYYISAAVVPQVGPIGQDLGSFSFNGVPISVTNDMRYGDPPIETYVTQLKDPGDLPPHGIFNTYFTQIAFTFDPDNNATEYNTQSSTGVGPTPNPNGTMYYQAFTIDTSLLNPNYFIHFDLYNSLTIPVTQRICSGTGRNKSCFDKVLGDDIEINSFAPFSHDAQSNGHSHSVPEPSALLLLGSGLLGLALYNRRRFKK